MHRYRLALFSSALMLAGCASAPKAAAPTDPAQARLDAAASDIQRSLLRLSEAEQYERMKVAPGSAHLLDQFPGLERKVTMPWNGPLTPAVMRLAAEGGYEFELLGRAPALPILVQIGPEPASISDHLRNLGVQAGDRADVEVSPRTPTRKGVIVVEYRNGGL